MKYRILSHTADLRVAVYGKTIEEIFENAVFAMAEILSGQKIKELESKKGEKQKITITAVDQNILLVDFLNKVLAKSNINKLIYFVRKIQVTSQNIKAEIIGFPVEEFAEDIKAVTYHEVKIEKNEIGYKVRLVMDI